MGKREELTDEQWAILEPLIPKPRRRSDGRGRPVVHNDRSVLNGVLWVLRTGAAWADLPDRFPSGSTCFRRCYNEERPHRALAGEVPAALYRPSVRAYPEREPEITYPGHFKLLRVCANGCLRWRRGFVFVSQVLEKGIHLLCHQLPLIDNRFR